VGSSILVAAEIDKVFIRRRRAQRDAHRTDAERDGESDRLPSERGGR
jgi:hypothetical protein